MSKPVTIVLHFSHQHRSWLASIFTRGVLQTSARGRSEESALADAVARFRSTRTLRNAA